MTELTNAKAPWDNLIDCSKYKTRDMEINIVEYEIKSRRPYNPNSLL